MILTFYLVSKPRSSAGARTEEEELACFLEQGKGVGRAVVTLCRDPDGQRVIGAAVVCDGGNDPTVRAEIVRLLCAALGIGANRVYVSASSTA